MTQAIYEFPLNEKVRTYLRLEQLFIQLDQVKQAQQHWQYINFFAALFTLLDLLERLDIRNDMLKDIDSHERNLVSWSQHPKIDNSALQAALQNIIRLRDKLKQSKKIGSSLKEHKFLSSIRQRFAIPGGTCSFDLPTLHYWLHQPTEQLEQDIDTWLAELALIKDAINVTLSFLRERGRFQPISANKAFYQGVADDKNELIRVYCATDKGYYPILSGNKYRYAIRFMWFSPKPAQSSTVEQGLDFELACC